MTHHTYVAKHVERQNSYQSTLHFHDSNEIFLSLNDQCAFFLNDRVYEIQRGVLILIPEGAIHRKVNPADLAVDTYTLHYPAALLDAYSTPGTDLTAAYGAALACIQLPEDRIAAAVGHFRRCLPSTDETFGSDLRRNLYFLDMLLAFHPLLADQGRHTQEHTDVSPLAAQLLAYINDHLTERFSLDALANEFFVSKYNLCRLFKKDTGFTIVEYTNSSRVRLACSILRQEKQVSNVGGRVGFANTSHFIHTFRKYTGLTPSGYANQYRGHTNVPIFTSFTQSPSF